MTNSEKQTKATAASSKASPPADPSPAYASRSFWKMVGGVLLLMGFGFSLHINSWHFTVPVVILWFGWAGVLATVALIWEAGMAVANEDSAERMADFDVSEARRHELEAEKKSLIQAIKEIEFDRDLGKMSEDDAKEMMKFYRARAIEVIKELDGQVDEELSVSARVDRDLKARMAVINQGKKASAAKSSAAKSSAAKSTAAKASEEEKASKEKASEEKASEEKASEETPADSDDAEESKSKDSDDAEKPTSSDVKESA